MAPGFEKEVEFELRLCLGALDGFSASDYKKNSLGRSFPDDFKNALETWLTAIYYRHGQPALKFEVLEFNYDHVKVVLAIDYLAPLPPICSSC